MTVVVAMDGNVQDVRVFIEDLLGSITVMDVLIKTNQIGHPPPFVNDLSTRMDINIIAGVTQSTMRMRSSLCLSLSCLAAMATELKKQNPMACWASAW
jgi:hypothetical protein